MNKENANENKMTMNGEEEPVTVYVDGKSDLDEQPMSELDYWKQVAKDAMTSCDTLRNDVQKLRQANRSLSSDLGNAKQRITELKAHTDEIERGKTIDKTPTLRDLMDGVNRGLYDVEINIKVEPRYHLCSDMGGEEDD